MEYDAGAASSGGAQQEADPPGQPIPFDSAQFYRWAEADACFYQPVGGPHVGARCSGSRAAGSWCPDDNIIPWSAPRSGVTLGMQTASRSTRMILSPAPTATMTISRRCLPRICARSQSARRLRRRGSRPPWLLSKPRSLWVGGSAPDATNGTCRSVTYVTVATGSVPRWESSRAVFQTFKSLATQARKRKSP